jgi:hypothetical protein
MAYMTTNPNGYAIFGRAVAKPYRESRDDATAGEIARQPWKKTYRHYIRVTSPEFIEGQLSDCVYLRTLIDELDSRALVSTARHLREGTGNIDPKKALRQQPGAWLTDEAAQLLSTRFDQLLASAGPIPESFLRSLPRPQVELPDRGDDRA